MSASVEDCNALLSDMKKELEEPLPVKGETICDIDYAVDELLKRTVQNHTVPDRKC